MAQIDFSKLVDALRQGDESKANELLREIMPRLIDYLRIVMGADRVEAKECAQQAFIEVFGQIKRDRIKEKKHIYSYMITTARNEFLTYKKSQHRFVFDPEEIYHQVEPARQIEALVEEERMKILRECLKELTQENRTLMNYLISHPDKALKKVSKKFGLTNANLRTKKSRLTNRLHHCFKRKSSD